MPRVLNSITLGAPASPVTAAVNDTFSFSGTPGFSGSGGVNRYDWKWEVDDGGGYVPIGASGTGLITAGTNPLVNSNSTSANAITVSCDEAGAYTIRMSGAPATGGSYTVFSATQTITVNAAPHDLLAADVASSSSVTSPSIGQAHALNAGDVQSASAVGSPALGQIHALLAADVASESSVSVPALAEQAADTVDDLLGDDVSSASSVTSPSLGQIHALSANDVASVSSVTSPTLAEAGDAVLFAESIVAQSMVSRPTLAITGQLQICCRYHLQNPVDFAISR